MAKQTDLFLTRNYRIETVEITNTAATTIFVAGADDSKVNAIAAVCDNTYRGLTLFISKAGVDYQIGSTETNGGNGFDSLTPTLNLLNKSNLPFLPVDSNDNPYLILAAGCSLKLKNESSAQTIVTVFGEDF